MIRVSRRVPDLLEDAIKSLVYEHGFPEGSFVEIEQIDSQTDVLSSAYTVTVKRDENIDSNECLNLFVKYMEDKDGRFVHEGRIFFKNEVVFYGELLETFKRMCVKCPQVLFKSAPKCYKSFYSPKFAFLIMDNLLQKNYHLLPTSHSVTLSQALQILDSLAKLHAISFIMKDQHPLAFHNIVDSIEEALFREETRPTFGKIFVHAIHDALKLAKSCLPPGSVYVEKLADFTLNVFDKMLKMLQEDEDEYKVVSHGDMRIGNVLVRDDADEVLNEVSILDYQACRYSSPAHDLIFFLLTSLDSPTRRTNLPTLIRRYHSTLCSCIAQAGSDPLHLFPMSALRAQIVIHAPFALGLALAGLPLYMDEGGKPTEVGENNGDVVEATKEAQGRKSMRCKNKMMEVVIDAVDFEWL